MASIVSRQVASERESTMIPEMASSLCLALASYILCNITPRYRGFCEYKSFPTWTSSDILCNKTPSFSGFCEEKYYGS